MNRLTRSFLLTCGAVLVTGFGSQAATSVNSGTIDVIHGPDELDLLGEFSYAINFSSNDQPVRVNGVLFTPDTTPPAGATLVGPNNVAPWQGKPDFGPSLDEQHLATVYEDIRWANAANGERLEAHLPVTPGENYKIQVLIYGNTSADDRHWDIEVEGALSVDEVTSLGVSPDGFPPAYDFNGGMVFTQTITAGDDTLDIVMGDLSGDYDGGDRNAIWQGLTVEHLLPDTDDDGLPDAWEMTNFSNLAQTAAGDADSDGLPNGREYTEGTDPNVADTDGDGLSDGLEVNTHATNPKVADTDGDTLSDGSEVNTHHTNPLTADTDLDGLTDAEEVNTYLTNPLDTDSDHDDYPDGIEVAAGTSPTDPARFPLLSSFARAITGGEAGEGLDLTGDFLYAFNVGTNGAPGLIQGVTFTDETNDGAGGITISPTSEIGAWGAFPELGTTDDDIALGSLFWSIRHAGGNGGHITVSLTGLTAGKPYKLQLLFMERCCARACDVYVDGVKKIDDFAAYTYQDGTGAPTRGAAVVIGFLASGTTTEIILDGSSIENPAYTDHNPILNGLTLEAMTGADADGDGMDDLWEVSNFGDLSQTAAGDFDADGLTNLQENTAGTDPKDEDSDDDGLKDGAEVATHLTNPKNPDTDGDGLSDGYEIATSLTNPLSRDSDGDGYSDSAEVAYATDPNNAGIFPLFSSNASAFTGGDAGEGLDLDGTFFAAARFGPTFLSGSWQVRDATFVPYFEVPSLTEDAVNEVDTWVTMNFQGALSTDDESLAEVVRSIRYQGTVYHISLPGLTVGTPYKLQLLFAEACCANRGFDIYVNNVLVADEFSPPRLQGGASTTPAAGAALTYVFMATSEVMDIRLDKRTVTSVGLDDPNPILNALTLEALTLTDSDGDGMADDWERQFFGDLSRGATGDLDGDGLLDPAEYLAGSRPDVADTDGDGLSDAGEVGLGSNPLLVDTDGDGLSDGAEANTYHTDPLNADTDNDTFSDVLEIMAGSNPLVAGSVPPPAEVGVFTGGDDGEGLDLDGTFLYAFNVGTNGAGGQARDANFTTDSAPGITISAVNQIPNWAAPNYGTTANDDVLEFVTRSIRWTAAPGTVGVNLAGLTPGSRYRLQLLFFETGTARGFDVKIEGGVIADDFSPGSIQGGVTTQGAVLAYEFMALDSVLNIVLDGNDTFAADKNPTLSAVTLEALAAPGATTLVLESISGTGVTFTAQGAPGQVLSLDYSPDMSAGLWSEVNDSVTIGATGATSVTDTAAAHRTPGRGFWRLRDPALQPNP